MLYDFNFCPFSSRHYDGNGGPKQGIILNGEPWFIKFPQSTKENRTREVSYTTSPLSEYLGSQIYGLIGLPVHETLLGIFSGKVVVACKDFLKDGDSLFEFSKIKNTYFPNMEELLNGLGTSGSSTDLKEIKVIMENNNVFIDNPNAKDRFWDMFVVDALIGNRDRNNGNWGFIKRCNNSFELAPVYDNGNSFANKAGDEKMFRFINDKDLLNHSTLMTGVCIFKENDKPINPYKYIMDSNDIELKKALLRIVPKIDIGKINEFLDNIPNQYNGLSVMSDIRREYYKKMLSLRYNEVLLPVYHKTLEEFEFLSDGVNLKTVDSILKDANDRCVESSSNTKNIDKEIE